ncbi:hypothetical protein Emtol_3257 [Emticicia oligotrophica DSM 17448]|uniref:DUF3307 domain-containing protein n=1 Tax=Emticicia oligotrophica (strain DSM 17448 / CIP 109782 / MTCC 6937 / GPTSA100-15) TaxID=929562 RepID=A0ABM5N4P5_EMTOG|nr:DUF3307 domain-containing protein [Emticicia oligotrophica]AFK04386.1 hypothetical protein Emtol_3257 [Emticicia oligotrophica DSM 17448]
MSNLFTAIQALVLLKLIFAHILTDFFLQPTSWVKDKEEKRIKSQKLLFHIILTFLTVWLFSRNFLVALFIGITHYGFDLLKIYAKDKSVKSFILDQVLHFIILIISWLYIIKGFNQFSNLFTSILADFKTWVILVSYVFCTIPLGILIGLATKRWREDVNTSKEESLNDAGKWIGIFERILILTFIINNQYEPIGFLIAAKALLRFKESDLKRTEYVLIGTLISFTLTISIGILVKMVL